MMRREGIGLEIRRATQRLLRSPAFVAAVVLSLAVGISVDVTMVSVVDALFFRPPAHVANVDRLVDVRVRTYPDYLDLRDQARSFTAVGGYYPWHYVMTGDGITTPVSALLTSQTLFPLLGVHPALGRFFLPEEDRPGGRHVAVLGYSLWQNRFGGARDAVGRTVHVAGDLYTIVGIAPKGFTGPGLAPVDLFLPIASTNFDAGREALTSRNYFWVRTVARLAPGVSLAAAQAEAKLIYHRGNPESTDSVITWLGGRPAEVQPLMQARRALGGVDAKVSLWLAGVATVVLLIACANVASLLLARAVRRRHELAVRAALGASRAQLVTSQLLESAMLGVAGGICGLLLAHWEGALIRRFLLTDIAASAPPLDTRVLVIAIAVTAVTILVCGLWPALRATRGDLPLDLASGARGTTLAHAVARRMLLVAQIALAFVLVVGAALFTTSLRNARTVDLGMSLDRVLIANVNLQGAGYTAARVHALVPRLIERLSAIPGVHSVAATGASVSPGWMNYSFSVPGRDSLPRVRALPRSPGYSAVTPGFFETIGTPIVLGRDFTEADRTRRVIIVSEGFARLYWPGENPLGQCVKIGNAKSPCAEVIGVTPPRRGGPLDTLALPETFVLLGSKAEPPQLAALFPASQVAVRVNGDPERVQPLMQSALQELLPDVPLAPVRPALSLFDRLMRPWRLGASLFTAFGAIALALAILGVYGVVAYSVGQRTREIGIRIALGATPGAVARLVLGETTRVAIAGLVLGAGIAVVVARAMGALLFGISPLNPAVYLLCAILLFGMAMLATAVPAGRAVHIDPTIALREE